MQISGEGGHDALSTLRHQWFNDLNLVHALLARAGRHLDRASSAHAVLEGTQERIRVIALVHAAAWRSQSPPTALASTALFDHLAPCFSLPHHTHAKVRLRTDIERVTLTFADAVALGLAARELISNAWRHAFVESNTGTVELTLSTNGPVRELSVSDDGCGLPRDLDTRKQSGLGLSLVELLAEQVEGELVLEARGGGGTRCTLRFPSTR